MKTALITLLVLYVTSTIYLLMVVDEYRSEANVQTALYKACTAELQWTFIKLEQN